MNLKRPIILCGFTSSGKTTVGTMLAEALGLPFYDTDRLLTEQYQMTIPEIFAKGGESLFRDLEHEIAKQVCTLGASVISTGGGMMTFPRNAELLTASGIVFYIDRSFENCYQSLSRQPDRPLYKNHTKAEMEETYRSRADQYMRSAVLAVNNDGEPMDAVRRICDYLENLQTDSCPRLPNA